MAIGRITGPMLFSNLDRQGVDLAIDGNLIYADVVNRRVGISTSTPGYALDVPGNVRLANITITGNTITSNTGKINLGSINNVVITGGSNTDIIYTDGAGNLNFADLSTFADFGELVANINAANAAIVTANNAVVSYVNTLNTEMVANVTATNAAIVTANNAVVSYVNTQDAALSANINAANAAIITANSATVSYVNTLNSEMVANITATNAAIVTANVNLKAYVDSQDSALVANITAANAAIVTANSAVVSYVNTLNSAMSANVQAANAAIVTANTSLKNYVDDKLSGTSYSNIYQQNSSVSVFDTGVGNVVVNIDGSNIAYFSQNSFTVSSLTLSNNSIVSQSNVVNFPGTGAITLPLGDSSNRPTGATGEIRYNTDFGTPEYYDGVSWLPVNNTVTDQSFSGDGSNVTYTLDQDANESGILVSINGTLQQPSVAYTVTGNQITFAEIPLITDVIDIRFLGGLISVNNTLSDDLAVSGDITAANIQINTGGFVKYPVYTISNLTTVTGQIGWTAAVSDSTPGGALVFWDTTNSRWSYVSNNSAV